MKTIHGHFPFIIMIFIFSIPVFTSLSLNGETSIPDPDKIASGKSPGGTEIPVNLANELIGNYRSIHKSEADNSIYTTTGRHINKKAIENILNNKDINSLALDLVEQDGKLKLIIKGSNIELSDIETGAGTLVYIAQSLCPTDCSNLNI